MLDVDIIIPCSSQNDHSYHLTTTCLRTCQAFTPARIHCYLNNSPAGKYRSLIEEECAVLGIPCTYMGDEMNLAKFFNQGRKNTDGKYIVYSSADVIFYPNWLENIVDEWEKNPDWFLLLPWGFAVNNYPGSRRGVHHSNQTVKSDCWSPVTVFRRDGPFEWDENLACWELDTDLHYYAKANGLSVGRCMNSRIDHLYCGFRCSVENFRDHAPGVNSSTYIKEKWPEMV